MFEHVAKNCGGSSAVVVDYVLHCNCPGVELLGTKCGALWLVSILCFAALIALDG